MILKNAYRGMGSSDSIGRFFQELYSKGPVTVIESYGIHNDLVAMNQTFRMDEFYYILLESPDTDETIQKRIRLTEKLSGRKFNRIMGEGKSMLSHLFSLLHGSDFVTYYLAELRNVDPIDVQIIEDFKAEMGKPYYLSVKC